MAEKGFEPLTGELGIAGTSYRLQLGYINEKWASRMLKGRDVIDSYVYKDDDMAADQAPNSNLIVGWVLRTVTLPNINPYGIMKTVQALVKQAMKNKEKRKTIAPIAETKEVELEKVPVSELKRPKASGWVKEEGTKTKKEQEEDQRAAFKERVAAEKAKEAAPAQPAKSTGKRQLPSIPSATPKAATSAAASPTDEESSFCPYCGKDIGWKFCPFCGKPLPHTHNE